MLRISGSARSKQGAGPSRRDFLRIGALGLTNFLLPDLLRARSVSRRGGAGRETSVVWLWLDGGASHLETFDPKTNIPVEFRSLGGVVQTRLPGVVLGGWFPRTAAVADRMAFVRSFHHTDSNHLLAPYWLMTGHEAQAADLGRPQRRPSCGAILARARGPNNRTTGMPNYVGLGRIRGDGPAWLGPTYGPFETSGPGRADMELNVPLDRLAERRDLLRAFDTLAYRAERQAKAGRLDSLQSQAFGLLLGRGRAAFDLSQESVRVREQYGPGVGEQLLLARRLCEAGVGFVTVNSSGWDMHRLLVDEMDKLGPPLDRAVAAFVADVAARGLDRHILLVVTGDFGRTPRINRGEGRDHWPAVSPLALAGGGLPMGQVVGRSNLKGAAPATPPIRPQDLMATVFHVLGLPVDLHFRDPSGRPVPLLESGRPIAQLVG